MNTEQFKVGGTNTLNRIITSRIPLVGNKNLNEIQLGSEYRIYPLDWNKYYSFVSKVNERKKLGLDLNEGSERVFNPFNYEGYPAYPCPKEKSGFGRLLFGNEKYMIVSCGIFVPGWETPAPEWISVFAKDDTPCDYFRAIKLPENVFSNLQRLPFFEEDEVKKYTWFYLKKDDEYSIYSEWGADSFKAGVKFGGYLDDGYEKAEKNREWILFSFLKNLVLGKETFLELEGNTYVRYNNYTDRYQFLSFKIKKEDLMPTLFATRAGQYGKYDSPDYLKYCTHSVIFHYVEDINNPRWMSKKSNDITFEELKFSHITGYEEPREEEYYDYDDEDNLILCHRTVTPPIYSDQYELKDIVKGVEKVLNTREIQGIIRTYLDGLKSLVNLKEETDDGTKIPISQFMEIRKLYFNYWYSLLGDRYNHEGIKDSLYNRIRIDSEKPLVSCDKKDLLEGVEEIVYPVYGLVYLPLGNKRLTLNERLKINNIFCPSAKIAKFKVEDMRYFYVTVSVEGRKRVNIPLEDIAEIAKGNSLPLSEIIKGKFSIIERKVEGNTHYQRIRPYLDEDSLAEWQEVKDQKD